MFRKSMVPLLAALTFLAALPPVQATQVESDSVYCFSGEDFSEGDTLRGICITGLPASEAGTLLLGSRVLRPGDILTTEQVAQMTFSALKTENDRTAQLSYLPIYENAVAPTSNMTISVLGREDKPPVAEDIATETYKNLPTTGHLKVTDPEGQAVTYTLTRQPRRGSVEIGTDGSFTYTPKKNKVGVDSFAFTATDPAGKVSREATVTITILKPTDSRQYQDTAGRECRFAAEWMRHTGIFTGENLAGNPCFNPDQTVSRGEFTSMLVKALELPTEELMTTGYSDEIPSWLKPYLAAAIRAGLTAGLPEQETFGADQPISGAEAAVMLQNALDLSATHWPEAGLDESSVPVWAESALTTLACNGMTLNGNAPLTRAATAQLLYQAVKILQTPIFTE